MSKTRILVAEDNPSDRALMEKLVQRAGYEVDCVEDGESCLEMFNKNSYGLVILDFIMPKINGIDTLKAIRKQKSPEELPVIMVTLKQKIELVRIAMKNGVNDFFVKPIDPSEFPLRISRHLLTFSPEEITAKLRSLSFADSSSLNRNIQWEIARQNLAAFPFECKGIKVCAVLPARKSPKNIAKSSSTDLEEEVTILGKGGFLWNIVWPRHRKANLELPRHTLNSDDEDISELLREDG